MFKNQNDGTYVGGNSSGSLLTWEICKTKPDYAVSCVIRVLTDMAGLHIVILGTLLYMAGLHIVIFGTLLFHYRLDSRVLLHSIHLVIYSCWERKKS